MPNQPEEWYDKRPFRDIYYHSDCEANCCCSAVYDIPAIIAEADRRASLRTCEDAEKLVELAMIKSNGLRRDIDALRGLKEDINSRIQQYGTKE